MRPLWHQPAPSASDRTTPLARAQARGTIEVMRRILLVFSLVVAWACWKELEPLPFEVGLEASRVTATPGDTISFVVTAQGGNLLGANIDFADGSTDQYGTSGARSARIAFKHAYLTKGTFQVQATVTDALAGPKNATVQVIVN